ncbi:MAG: UDP-N-acetylmuramoyl-tripeptide--D-alanyl-D-alanine ligase [Eubacteriaceae bacterium]|jgi:UDP-N-acetylmuramoyl-tripeptide--D-alanyl-D-alanine ligase|nr:UDP-N-acetylmuramoyl-tripeptide--D-alanyl-D-alanine ligase [Eubacteriaceae bacterium]
MKEYTINKIAEITGGTVISGNGEASVDRAFADSREAGDGSLFFALAGENRDGHEFIGNVIDAGGRFMVISDEDAFRKAAAGRKDITAVKVADTSAAMRALAKDYLMSLDSKRIGITGSTGKTSTKDMTYAVCRTKFRTGRNLGNLNTEQGLCMTILGFAPDTEVTILEMGMYTRGEIHELADFIRPHIALMTNIGVSHIEFHGTRDSIFHAKMEIVDFFEDGDVLIASKGPDFLQRQNIGHGYWEGAEVPEGTYRVVMTGEDADNDYVISGYKECGLDGIEFDITHEGALQHFRLPVMGRHNALNAALAVAAGGQLGISLADAARGLAGMELTAGRLTVRKGLGGFDVIDDTYNANPESMGAAIRILAGQKAERHVAVLGEMYELGDITADAHFSMGKLARDLGVDEVIAIGPLAKKIAEGAGDIASYYETKEEFIENRDEHIKAGDIVLIKASHGLHLEEVTKVLTEVEK